jgi:radical SAM protein with 4Fe4S-binding SPASM domain
MTSVQVSMHHFDAAIMDRLTDHAGSFQKTLTGVQNTVRILGPERISVNMVVMKPTVSDVYQMGMFLREHGVLHFSVGLVSYCGMAARNDLLVDASDVVTVYNQLDRLAAETGMEVAFTGGMPHCVVPEREGSSVVMANVCDAALYQLVIGPDGLIRPCVESHIVAGNALTDDIRTVWQTSPELISIRQFEDVPPSCWPCLKVSQCHGGCRASAFKHTGDVRGLDPLMIGGGQ